MLWLAFYFHQQKHEIYKHKRKDVLFYLQNKDNNHHFEYELIQI